MTRTVAIFAVSAFVLLGVALWTSYAGVSGSVQEIIVLAIVLVMVGFAVFKGIERLRSSKRNEAYEDELSKKTMTKSSSLSYYISLYLWLIMMYISDHSHVETHTLIGTGIACMALIFLVSWIWVKKFGMKNE
jgi:peptidoglycan/LPS O-acetylase OafA/YrhL